MVEPSNDATGCSIVEAPCSDWIALVRRGGCSFVTKVRNMQKSGAIAVAVGDPDKPGWITMYAPGKNIKKNFFQMFIVVKAKLTLVLLFVFYR
jgi:E3 ubiquitin-protein ligase RNF13